MKQKQVHRHREQTVVVKGEWGGDGVEWKSGLANVSYCVWNG